MLAYVTASAVYSITEAGFRMLDPIWIFLLLAVIASSGIVSIVGAPDEAKKKLTKAAASFRTNCSILQPQHRRHVRAA
jgi:hypothetical protein